MRGVTVGTVTALSVMVAVLAGCNVSGGPSPTDTVNKYHQAMMDEDVGFLPADFRIPSNAGQ